MKIFNRILVILIFVAIFVIGLFGVLYGFQWLGYSLFDFPAQAQQSVFYSSLQTWIDELNAGSPTTLTVISLVATAIAGIILLFLELKPKPPQKVRLGKSMFITREAVASEAERGAMMEPEVSEAKAHVKARRGPGAKVTVHSKVRRGIDLKAAQQDVRSQVENHLLGLGIPVSSIKVDVEEIDPRKSKVRVK